MNWFKHMRNILYVKREQYFFQRGMNDDEVKDQAYGEGVCGVLGVLVTGWAQWSGRYVLACILMCITWALVVYAWIDDQVYRKRIQRRKDRP